MTVSCTLALCLLVLQHAPSTSPADEVVRNLKQQPIGTATLDDLGLSDEYLERVAGRILRTSFEQNFRVVVADEKPASAPSDVHGGVDKPGTPGLAWARPALQVLTLTALVVAAAVFIGVRRAMRRRSIAP
jgi:hypothetical protein